MSTNYPNAIDTDVELPRADDAITELNADIINAVRSAVFAIESEVGVGGHGTLDSISSRLNVSINLDGTINPAALTGIGLIALPITDSQVSSTAAIQETKLSLAHTTTSLYNLYTNLQSAVNTLDAFYSVTGIKVEPHIAGTGYKHNFSHLNVDSPLSKVNISSGTIGTRSNTNGFSLISDISNDLLSHEKANGTSTGSIPPANFAHNASGISINSSNFTSVPQTTNDLQSFAEYVDNSSLLLLGSRTQNLYDNGIPKSLRGLSLVTNSAEPIVPYTAATTYLLFSGSTSPVDDISHGDDVILFNPSGSALSSFNFDAQFSQIKPGDIATIIYEDGYSPVSFSIDSTKIIINGSSRTYAIRINGKNLYSSSTALVKIDRSFYHDNRFGQLAVAAANNDFSSVPSLIIANPRSASAIGVGLNANKIDSTHYNLYLTIYPTGNPLEKTLFLPPVDVTGNQGTTPGKYTLSSLVQSTNDAFRKSGFNFRFIAFSYQGEFGIMLSDHYNNASFSISSGTVDISGNYNAGSNSSFQKNIIDPYNNIDPLGFSSAGSNAASPPFSAAYTSALNAFVPTRIFSPLKRSFFYVNGVERDTLGSQPSVLSDGYGDGYWPAILSSKTIYSNRVEATYIIDLDLEASGLKAGKTLVVQPAVSVSSGSYSAVDYGRFTINNVSFSNCPGPNPVTTITIYDAVHGTGNSPYLSSSNIPVRIYFSNDSVSFDSENVSDSSGNTTYKRFFEIFVDSNGNSFSHERSRFSTSGTDIIVDSITGFTLYNSPELANVNAYDISSKLRGYKYGQYSKITLFINSYDAITGNYNGYLCKFDSPSTFSHIGQVSYGKKGEIVRFYDETGIDYIDFIVNLDDSVASFSNKKIDIQLFPSLILNKEKIFIATCQINDSTKKINFVNDKREFGNVSEQQLSKSAIDFINANSRAVLDNGIINGFDVATNTSGSISLNGGSALINGKLVQINNETVNLPAVSEAIYPAFSTTLNTISWFVCANYKGELELIASTDYDLSLSATYGSLDHNRLFYVKKNSAVYNVRATYLQNMISSFRDVVPLYLVSATLTGNVISSITYSDIRRFISGGYSGYNGSLSLGLNANFKTINALNNWISQLLNFKSFNANSYNKLGSKVDVKDLFDISNANISFSNQVVFEGNDGGFYATLNVGIGNNLYFKNTSFNLSSSALINVTGSNVTFENVLFNLGLSNYINITGTSVKFKNCTFNVVGQTGVQLMSDVSIEDCIFNYSYDATGNGSFVVSNLGNSSKACLFSSTSNSYPNRKNIYIKDNVFNFSTANHFSAISFLVNAESDYHENIIIKNNKFYNSIAADDKRSVISFVSTLIANPSLTSGPRVVDCVIENNICDKNQLIMMTATLNGSNVIANALVPMNVSISENVCGAICYLTKQDVVAGSFNNGKVYDKYSIILIKNNICKFIYCGFSTGLINNSVPLRNVFAIVGGQNVYSSSATISRNYCSWIQVGLRTPTFGTYENPTLEISGNTMKAYNPVYLNDYYYSGSTVLNTAIYEDLST